MLSPPLGVVNFKSATSELGAANRHASVHVAGTTQYKVASCGAAVHAISSPLVASPFSFLRFFFSSFCSFSLFFFYLGFLLHSSLFLFSIFFLSFAFLRISSFNSTSSGKPSKETRSARSCSTHSYKSEKWNGDNRGVRLVEHDRDTNLSNLKFADDILDDLNTATTAHGLQPHPAKPKPSPTRHPKTDKNTVALQGMNIEILPPGGKIKYLGQCTTFKNAVQVEQEESRHDADSNPSFDNVPNDDIDDELEPCAEQRTRQTTCWQQMESRRGSADTGKIDCQKPRRTLDRSISKWKKRYQPSRKGTRSKEDRPRDGKTTSALTCNKPEFSGTTMISRTTRLGSPRHKMARNRTPWAML